MNDWIEAGFDVDEADAWLDVGCRIADIAAALRRAGYTPSDVASAARRVVARGYYGCPVDGFCRWGDVELLEELER